MPQCGLESSTIHHGAKHIFDMISKGLYLPQDLKTVFHSVIQTNAFFAHPENMLIAMITDEKYEIRELGLKDILEARNHQGDDCVNIRKFMVPKINFEAKEYFDLIALEEDKH